MTYLNVEYNWSIGDLVPDIWQQMIIVRVSSTMEKHPQGNVICLGCNGSLGIHGNTSEDFVLSHLKANHSLKGFGERCSSIDGPLVEWRRDQMRRTRWCDVCNHTIAGEAQPDQTAQHIGSNKHCAKAELVMGRDKAVYFHPESRNLANKVNLAVELKTQVVMLRNLETPYKEWQTNQQVMDSLELFGSTVAKRTAATTAGIQKSQITVAAGADVDNVKIAHAIDRFKILSDLMGTTRRDPDVIFVVRGLCWAHSCRAVAGHSPTDLPNVKSERIPDNVQCTVCTAMFARGEVKRTHPAFVFEMRMKTRAAEVRMVRIEMADVPKYSDHAASMKLDGGAFYLPAHLVEGGDQEVPVVEPEEPVRDDDVGGDPLGYLA